MNFTDYSIENTQSIGGNVFDSVVPNKVVDFSGFNNMVKTPVSILRQLKRCDLTTRPDIAYKKAIANLALHHDLQTTNIIIDSSVYNLLNITLKSLKIRSASVMMPCETEYKHICRINNCDIIPYILSEKQNFKLDCDDFIEKITTKSDAVILSNPCNATGRVISKSDMNVILDYCQSKGIYVIVDESYMDFVLNGQSCISLLSDYHNLVVLRSISEYYNLSAVNVAYAVASNEVTELIAENQLPWQVDKYGCILCENAYKFEKFDLKTKKWIFEDKKYLLNKLKIFDSLRVIHSDCHYVLVSLGEVSATTVYTRLLKSNILIRDASAFVGLDGSYVRISLRNKKEIDLFAEELMRCLI